MNAHSHCLSPGPKIQNRPSIWPPAPWPPRDLARALALALLLTLSLAAAAQVTFTKITTGPVVADGADGEGCAWVDYDQDGDLDLYVSCDSTGANLLYRNDGSSVFTKITAGATVTSGGRSVSASWADMNNDGRIDLFTSRQNNGPGLLFLQQQDGAFAQSALPSGGFSWGSAWGDYDNDGFVDLLVGDTTRSVLWHNDGQGGLVAVTNTPIVTRPNASNITYTDYDNDGDADLLVTGSTTTRLYQNTGQGAFMAVTNGAFPTQIEFGTGAAWADCDNDGFLDLFLCRLNFQQRPPSFLFHNNGDGTFTQITQAPFTNDTGFSVNASWGDYDNDGWVDLFVTNFGNGLKNRLYHNNGDGTFARVTEGSVANDLGNSAGSAWGDYDRDGFLDLFVANGTNNTQERNDFLYHNDGNTNAWLTIRCVGTTSNRSAIGAKVRVKATINGETFWQLREINTGNGWGQSALEAHFGLGNATNVETLRIEWPSGAIQEFENVPAKQYRTVTEPARLSAAQVDGTPQFTLHGGRGMPYEIQTSTDLSAWLPLTSVAITNLNGTAPVSVTNAPSLTQRFIRAVLR